ncbi:hypothetical protein BDN71DRAFT_188367 [Pleurotus eryngii]|uniref:Uncharacterized protein n=1 Tax=Pleurotus eryngii TaxID=5323 RepID=A0A9P5ZLG9_PLEER|nr:hypothetical protein BDN71DRAFT_188367 [Pleurotus eryngii]
MIRFWKHLRILAVPAPYLHDTPTGSRALRHDRWARGGEHAAVLRGSSQLCHPCTRTQGEERTDPRGRPVSDVFEKCIGRLFFPVYPCEIRKM